MVNPICLGPLNHNDTLKTQRRAHGAALTNAIINRKTEQHARLKVSLQMRKVLVCYLVKLQQHTTTNKTTKVTLATRKAEKKEKEEDKDKDKDKNKEKEKEKEKEEEKE